MSEKTAEEKLREELEGNSANISKRDTPERARPVRKSSTAPENRSGRSRARSKKSERPESVGRRVDSFMEDFEKRVAESLSANRVSETHSQPSKPRAEEPRSDNDVPAKIAESLPEKQESEAKVDILPEPAVQKEDVPAVDVDIPQEAEPVTAPLEPAPTAELDYAQEVTPSVDESIEPQESQDTSDVDAVVSETQPDVDEITEPEDSQDSQDDEPVIPVDLVEPSEEEIDDDLPDIPVIDAEEINSTDNDELPAIPVIGSESDTPEQNETFTESSDDFSGFTEETEDEQSAETPLPPADVVVSVDSEIPGLAEETQEIDPESESVPVTVTMPETTKTAEDKLMADIAEAMTGSPLTLDSLDDSQPYKLPEDFLSANQDSINISDPQSAEDKLIANISQAMSESPIGAAQDNANQSLEDDLNPFDEMPLPAAVPSEDFDYDEPEQPEEEDSPFLDSFSDSEQQDAAESETEPEIEQLTEQETEQEESDSDITENIVDKDDDIHDDFSDLFAVNEPDSEPEPEDDTPQDDSGQTEQDFSFPDISADDILLDRDTTEINEDIEPQLTEDTALTAEDRLAKEIAAFSQQDNSDNEISTSGDDNMPDEITDTYTHQEEADSQDNMPEQNLLPEDEMTAPEFEDDDDFDMSSLGDAASIYDDSTSHEDFSEPGPEPEQEVPPTESYSFNASEQKETEKTMTIRGKLKAKKDGEASSGGSRFGGLLVPILLALVLLVGALSLLKLYDIADKLTLAGMNTDSSITMSSPETVQSYEYAIDFILDNNITERMAARGREGWQVVGSRRTQDTTTNQYGYEFIFMRKMAGRQ